VPVTRCDGGPALLALERDSAAVDQLEACMRAAHSLKGAASIVGLTLGVRVAHAMEDCFVAAQQGRMILRRAQIDLLLGGADLLMRISATPEEDLGRWAAQGMDVGDELSVILMGDSSHTYGLVVDRFLGERDLVVQPLDAQLGKIKDIAAGALMPDGSPVLIVDADDLIRSMDKLVSGGRLSRVQQQGTAAGRKRKRVLVVDDSLTVREVERKLLGNRGYEVEVAVDGMDGWNAVRTGHFNLVVTDIDMPRMDGIELVTLINKDPNLKSLPVVVVSYKDRDEDRQRGLEAGAAYYLTKGSFHDETLVRAVVDLIGEADS
jgi:CheY-like chemotaxis protein/HPt (histidine-containing phosphotransfer) domain-containing protein